MAHSLARWRLASIVAGVGLALGCDPPTAAVEPADASATVEDAIRADRAPDRVVDAAHDEGARNDDAAVLDASAGVDAAARVVTCADEPPPGADLPDPLPVYGGGTCPTLVPGQNVIVTSGASRQFLLVVPAGLDPAERLPVIFMWHWLGAEAADFLDRGEAQIAADAWRFIAALPISKDDIRFKWPFTFLEPLARLDEEARFFDDMLACIAEQYLVNRSCVASVGVSAGGAWTAQLAMRRSRLLSSITSLSGGVGQDGDWYNPAYPWATTAHRLPALILWGGPNDFCGLSFATMSLHLEDALEQDGHFIVECIHNCSHSEPPLEPPPGDARFSLVFRFVLDHPFWLYPGESPYQVTGLPAAFPSWCGIGVGSATMRVGACEGGLLGQCI